MIHKAIYDLLSADGSVTANLATYDGSPAIFTCPEAPSDTECPYIHIQVMAGGVNDMANPRCWHSWSEDVYVRIYQDKTYSVATVSDIGQAVFLALDRQTIDDSGNVGILAARGSTMFFDEQGFPGVEVIVSAAMWREE